MVTSAAADPDLVYHVVRSVFERLDEFRRMHPAFADLVGAQMVREGLSAPLHEGALRYFREAGLR